MIGEANRISWTLDASVGRWTLDPGRWMLHFGRWALSGHLLTVLEQNQKPVSDSA